VRPPLQSCVSRNLDDPRRRPGRRTAIALGAGLIEDALGPSVVVDARDRPPVSDAGVIILDLVLLEAEVRQGANEAPPPTAPTPAPIPAPATAANLVRALGLLLALADERP
jgi:hypothetical protein